MEFWPWRSTIGNKDLVLIGLKGVIEILKASSRRQKRNDIKGFEKEEEGNWTTLRGEIIEALENYFSEIFSTSLPNKDSIEALLDGVDRKILASIKKELDGPFTTGEVKRALFSMSLWKASEPNGFHTGFYQESWDLLGADVTQVCLKVLDGLQTIDALNETYVVLISKIKSLMVSDYRPISLCNVIYKIITKTMANRLKHHLPIILSDEQSAFVSGKLITDNIETLHSLRWKTEGKKGLMALKLDMNRAYNRVRVVISENHNV